MKVDTNNNLEQAFNATHDIKRAFLTRIGDKNLELIVFHASMHIIQIQFSLCI